jgi:hypothetical protein
MKKIIPISLLLIIALNINAQKNALYVTFQPIDLGIGIRYDRHINHDMGLYSSLSWGNYKSMQLQDFSNQSFYIKNHYKVAFGMMLYLENKILLYENNIYFSLGVSYHIYGEHEGVMCNENTVFLPLSYEVGVGTKFKRMNISVRYDMIKHESSFDIGFNF